MGLSGGPSKKVIVSEKKEKERKFIQVGGGGLRGVLNMATHSVHFFSWDFRF